MVEQATRPTLTLVGALKSTEGPRCTNHPDRPAVVEITFRDLEPVEWPGGRRTPVKGLCRPCSAELRRAFMLLGVAP